MNNVNGSMTMPLLKTTLALPSSFQKLDHPSDYSHAYWPAKAARSQEIEQLPDYHCLTSNSCLIKHQSDPFDDGFLHANKAKTP